MTSSTGDSTTTKLTKPHYHAASYHDQESYSFCDALFLKNYPLRSLHDTSAWRSSKCSRSSTLFGSLLRRKGIVVSLTSPACVQAHYCPDPCGSHACPDFSSDDWNRPYHFAHSKNVYRTLPSKRLLKLMPSWEYIYGFVPPRSSRSAPHLSSSYLHHQASQPHGYHVHRPTSCIPI